MATLFDRDHGGGGCYGIPRSVGGGAFREQKEKISFHKDFRRVAV